MSSKKAIAAILLLIVTGCGKPSTSQSQQTSTQQSTTSTSVESGDDGIQSELVVQKSVQDIQHGNNTDAATGVDVPSDIYATVVSVTSKSPNSIKITRFILNGRTGEVFCDSNVTPKESDLQNTADSYAVIAWNAAIGKTLSMGDSAPLTAEGACGDTIEKVQIFTDHGDATFGTSG